MKRSVAQILSLGLFSVPVFTALPMLNAQTESEIVWTNGSGNNDWGTAGNWDIGFTPEDFEWAVINLAGEDRAIFDSSEGNAVLYLRVGEGEGESGELDVLSGTLDADQPGSESHFGSGGGTGILNVMGGTLSTGAAQNHIGLGEGSEGLVNVSGGTLIFGRESNGTSAFLGAEGGTGTLTVSGGAYRSRAGVILGSEENPDPEEGWPAGFGTFSVEGSDIDEIGIGAQGSVPGQWIQNSGSTLRIRVDEVPPDFGGGVQPIDVVQFDGSGGDVVFEDGALLDVGFLEGEAGGTYVVMRWQGELTDNGLQFADSVDTEIWSFEFDLENQHLLVTSSAEGGNGPVLGDDGTWISEADGDWSDSGNWQDGVIADGTSATADFSTLDIPNPLTVTLDGDRTIGNLLFADLAGENGWTLGPEAADLETEEDSGAVLTMERIGGDPTIEVADAPVRIERRIGGVQGFAKTGPGVFELTNPSHPFSGDITITEGLVRALTGGNSALGAGTVGGIDNRIVVEDGGTFELGANVQITNKQVQISGTGASDGEGGTLGAFYVDATGTVNGTRWSHNGDANPAISLAADATIRIDGDGAAERNTDNLLTNHLDLGGHTLTKTGFGRMTLDQNNTATGTGTLHIAEGVLGVTHNDIRNGVDLIIGEDGEVWGGRDPAPINSTTNTVTVDGRLVMTERDDTLNTNQNVGVLLGSGIITTGIWGNTGTHTLNINHDTEDSFYSGVIEEEAGTIEIVKGQVPDEDDEPVVPGVLTLDGNVRHHGDTTINHGGIVLGENGVYTFYIGSSGANNEIVAGDGAEDVWLTLNGSFHFDLSEAGTSMGNSWTVVDVGNLQVAYGETFRVSGFSEIEEGVWGTNANEVGYQFTESTTTLEVVEPFEDIESGYDQWQSEFLADEPPENQAPDADPDGDGYANLLEYAFEGDPLQPYSATLPAVQTAADGEDEFLEITFARIDADDIVYRVEAAGAPGGEWTEIWNSNDNPFSGSEETVRDTQPVGDASARFLRVSVAQQ